MPVKHLFLFLLLAALATAAAFYETKRISAPALAPLPEISFYGKSGQAVTLADFRGKTVLVNLWATWCPPCVAEMPALDRLQAAMPQDRFAVVAISLDRSSWEDVETFLRDKGIRHLKTYWDRDRQATLKWSYSGLPTSFLLDREGKIIRRYEGPRDWDKEEMPEAL